MDEKTDGTRGSPTNSDGGLFDRNDDEEDDNEDDDIDIIAGSTTGMDDYDNESFSVLTRNAVSQISRLGGSGEKAHFEPIVQVVRLKKTLSSPLYDMHISDGMFFYMRGTCSEAVSALADEEYFTIFSLIKVQEFATTTLANGMKSCELLRVKNTMIPNPGWVIGNIVSISLPAPAKSRRSRGGGTGDDFSSIMRMMMMQQQSDREQRAADCERQIFQAQQDKIEQDERSRQLQLEREDRAEQAREDRKQQQQFMNMMMMQMFGGQGRNKRGTTMMEETSDEDNNGNETTTPNWKSPRKK